ncbi:Ubiquitin C-terminal hydrolase 12-like protein [Drosera capensis]
MAVLKQVKLSHNAELRLLQVFQNKIFKIPEEEKNVGPDDHVVHVAHYMKDMDVLHFGEPFMVIHCKDPFKWFDSTTYTNKLRLNRVQKKLHVLDEELSQWKFAYMEAYHHEHLQDSDVVFSFFQKEKGPWQQYLGLEHNHASPKRPCVANQNRYGYEKPIKIYN